MSALREHPPADVVSHDDGVPMLHLGVFGHSRDGEFDIDRGAVGQAVLERDRPVSRGTGLDQGTDAGRKHAKGPDCVLRLARSEAGEAQEGRVGVMNKLPAAAPAQDHDAAIGRGERLFLEQALALGVLDLGGAYFERGGEALLRVPQGCDHAMHGGRKQPKAVAVIRGGQHGDCLQVAGGNASSRALEFGKGLGDDPRQAAALPRHKREDGGPCRQEPGQQPVEWPIGNLAIDGDFYRKRNELALDR